MIKAVTFDCWDTILIDDVAIEERMQAHFQKMCEQKGLYLTQAEIFNLFSKEKEVFQLNIRRRLQTPDAMQRMETLCGLVKLNFSPEEKKEGAAYFNTVALACPPPPLLGIQAVLEKLSVKYDLALICNTGWHSGKVVRQILESYDMLKYFRQLSFSDEIGRAKPHPKIFEQTVQNLDCPAENCVHIGDAEETDISGAKGSGMKAILFAGANRGNGIHSKADFRIDNYRNLERLIGKL